MSNLARKIHNDVAPGPADEQVTEQTGRVVALRADGSIAVRTGNGDHEARRALSCLVAPEVSDLVLVALSPTEGAFVLAVLKRESGAATALAVDGDLEVRLTSGRFRVAAQEGVELVSARTVSVVAAGLDLNAGEGNVVLQRLSFLGDAVRAEIDRVRLIAGRFDSVLERLSQRVKRSYRTVEEMDQLRAERIDYTAEKTMSLHAEHTLVTADELVKLDGEQIHLG